MCKGRTELNLCYLICVWLTFRFSGTTISRVEDQFSVFAPNAKALQEAVDKINELTTEKVNTTDDKFIIL